METASIAELKKKMNDLSPKVVKDLCLRLAKYKKENKELLSYLLFYGDDEEGFIREVKEEMDLLFAEVNQNLYWAKKTIRKILRIVTKYIQYSGNKQTEVELLLYFCQRMKTRLKDYSESPTLNLLFNRQLLKIGKALASLHEDLQFDYADAVASILSK